ncbi:MAG TPA: Flp pilus assembly protein CpaB [Bdellovibrionota bacterium]|jgi:pilus assembly protein CpaB
MNNRAFTISFVVAALAVMMVYSYVSSTEESYRQMYGTDKAVVVAKRNIKELDVLDETNLTLVNVPAKFVQPGTGNKLEDFKSGLAIAPITEGEQITRTKVTMLGARTGLDRQIAVGKRAVTIRVNDETGVAKLLKPGNRVDVLSTIDPSGSGNKLFLETRTILQDVLILATGKFVTNTVPGILETDPYKPEGAKNQVNLSTYTQYANITLEVDPFQAQTLVYAAKNLDIYVALRNNDDNVKEDLGKTMMKDLMGKDGANVQGGAGKDRGPPANLTPKH